MADPAPEFDGRIRADFPPGVFGMMAVLVTATVIGILYFAREVFIPITLAVLLSFLLAPAVRWLRRLRVGRITAVVFTVMIASWQSPGSRRLSSAKYRHWHSSSRRINTIWKPKSVRFPGWFPAEEFSVGR